MDTSTPTATGSGRIQLVANSHEPISKLALGSDSREEGGQASVNSVLITDQNTNKHPDSSINSHGNSNENLMPTSQSKRFTMGASQTTIPKTDFECTDKAGRFVSGLFADQDTGCRVWHLCSNNRKYSFLCPSGTVFNAKLRICDWRYNVKCDAKIT